MHLGIGPARKGGAVQACYREAVRKGVEEGVAGETEEAFCCGSLADVADKVVAGAEVGGDVVGEYFQEGFVGEREERWHCGEMSSLSREESVLTMVSVGFRSRTSDMSGAKKSASIGPSDRKSGRIQRMCVFEG